MHRPLHAAQDSLHVITVPAGSHRRLETLVAWATPWRPQHCRSVFRASLTLPRPMWLLPRRVQVPGDAADGGAPRGRRLGAPAVLHALIYGLCFFRLSELGLKTLFE